MSELSSRRTRGVAKLVSIFAGLLLCPVAAWGEQGGAAAPVAIAAPAAAPAAPAPAAGAPAAVAPGAISVPALALGVPAPAPGVPAPAAAAPAPAAAAPLPSPGPEAVIAPAPAGAPSAPAPVAPGAAAAPAPAGQQAPSPRAVGAGAQVQPPPPKEAAPAEAESKEEGPVQPPPTLHRFGMDFFVPARKRLLELERRIESGELKLPSLAELDALSGFVGPLEMISSAVYATVPQRYALSPGDRLKATFWGPMFDLQQVDLVVDANGYVTLPKVGTIVARGMSLEQFQNALRDSLRQVTVKDLQVIVTLDRLKSIQVFITGEAFRPGSYAVSAVTTLFNALYACGGPSDLGSLRDVRLLRGQKTVRVDFYDYLLRGDSASDLPLQVGDTLFIAPAQKVVSIQGEVRRPAEYELKQGEHLRALIDLAQGIKPTGVLQRIRVLSVEPHREKVVRDVDLTAPGHPDPELHDGDSVTVEAVLPLAKNYVLLQGAVERPGMYELKKGMRVSDLFSDVNRPLGEAYQERADIIRYNEDLRTTRVIPFRLDKALSKTPGHDLELASWDRVVVYSRWDVEFIPPRTVTVAGAVQRPGDYERQDGMRVKDLVLHAGGVLPKAYLPRADLYRYDWAKEMTILVPVDLEKALAGDPAQNVLIDDKDLLRVYALDEVGFVPPRIVTVAGAVQKPGEYPRSEKMRVVDLLYQAGGALPTAHLERADLYRYDYSKEMTALIPIDLRAALAGDLGQNIEMADKDLLRVYSFREVRFVPDRLVSIFGAVQKPKSYARSEGMTLKDLVLAAGGPMPGYKDEIEIARARLTGEIEILRVDLRALLEKGVGWNLPLEDGDVVMVKKHTEFFDHPTYVSLGGEVLYAGTYALESRMDHLSDLLTRAGGFTKLAYPKGILFQRRRDLIPSEEQRQDLEVVNKVVNIINDLDYQRQLAKNQYLMAKETGAAGFQSPIKAPAAPVVSSGQPAQAAAIGMAPGVAEAAAQTTYGAVSSFETLPAVVSPARKLENEALGMGGELSPGEMGPEQQIYERIVVPMEQVLANPEGPEDPVLQPGDRITIPQRPTTVTVVGAVVRPTTVAYRPGGALDEYVAMAGNYTEDANTEKIVVLRADGSIVPGENQEGWLGAKTAAIEPGDIVYVPPKVMRLEVAERIDKILDTVKYALTTAAGVAVFITLVTLF